MEDKKTSTIPPKTRNAYNDIFITVQSPKEGKSPGNECPEPHVDEKSFTVQTVAGGKQVRREKKRKKIGQRGAVIFLQWFNCGVSHYVSNYTLTRTLPLVLSLSRFSPTLQGFEDGPGIDAMFNYPCSVYIDGKNLFVADKDNRAVRTIGSDLSVSTLLGPDAFKGLKAESKIAPICPRGVGIDADGNAYVADLANHIIWKLTPGKELSCFAGKKPGFMDGKGDEAKFNCPCSLAVNKKTGMVYVTDLQNNTIRQITKDGQVSTLAGNPKQGFKDGKGSEASFNFPCGVVLDFDGVLYVADSDNNAIRKITPDGVVSTIAGGKKGHLDGLGKEAQFNGPCGLDVDQYGNIYVADAENFMVRRINRDGKVITLAKGGGGSEGSKDHLSVFDCPCDVAVDKELNIYVADWWKHRIRMLRRKGSLLSVDDVVHHRTQISESSGGTSPKAENATRNTSHQTQVELATEWILSTTKINLTGTICIALCLESITASVENLVDPHIVITICDKKGLICGKSVRTQNLGDETLTPSRVRRRSSLFKLPIKLPQLPKTQTTPKVTGFSSLIYLCPPHTSQIRDDDYVVFFELKHWKEQSSKFSVRCFAFMPFRLAMLKSNQNYALPLYHKPTDFTRAKLSPFRGEAYLRLEWLPYHSQLR
uniref:C2 Aida-type domain-containing protein n=1 Tax=Amorphochlora amoebiformis TaxID=1561963 RepID=A0A7S0GKV1_9EUKA